VVAVWTLLSDDDVAARVEIDRNGRLGRDDDQLVLPLEIVFAFRSLAGADVRRGLLDIDRLRIANVRLSTLGRLGVKIRPTFRRTKSLRFAACATSADERALAVLAKQRGLSPPAEGKNVSFMRSLRLFERPRGGLTVPRWNRNWRVSPLPITFFYRGRRPPTRGPWFYVMIAFSPRFASAGKSLLASMRGIR
jgi:hypothetical protein